MMVVSIYPLWDSQEIGNKYCKTYAKKICKKEALTLCGSFLCAENYFPKFTSNSSSMLS